MAPVERLPQIKTLLEKCLKEANPQDAKYISSALSHVEREVKVVEEAMGVAPKEEKVQDPLLQNMSLTPKQKLTIDEMCAKEKNYVTLLKKSMVFLHKGHI